jgi:hypothetical protein
VQTHPILQVNEHAEKDRLVSPTLSILVSAHALNPWARVCFFSDAHPAGGARTPTPTPKSRRYTNGVGMGAAVHTVEGLGILI